MYSLNDRKSFEKRVQEFLNKRKSGVFDIKTRAEIKKIQKESGLEETGRIDFKTFNSIKTSYLNRKKYDEAFSRFPVRIPVFKNDYSVDAETLNGLMEKVASYYSLPFEKTRGKYFSTESIELMNTLRFLFVMGDGELADCEFFIRLCEEVEALGL